MLPIQFRLSRLAVVARFGAVVILLALSFLAGCARFGFHGEKVSLDPSPGAGQKSPLWGADPERFAVTNEAKHIEDRLLDSKRQTVVAD
ncbi:MAG: hypothetical protein U1E05_14335 [Patescibacteria group bacterium]|nr:hypothetical protein [Patescibacteria group bacterium]